MGEITVRLTVADNGMALNVPRGIGLQAALVAAGCQVPAYCGGTGNCGKCRVVVEGDVSPANKIEMELLTPGELQAGWRLACQVRLTGDTTVRELEQPVGEEMSILQDVPLQRVHLNPDVSKHRLVIRRDPANRRQSNEFALRAELPMPLTDSRLGIEVLRRLPEVTSGEGGEVTVVESGGRLVSLERGDTVDQSFGLAIDLGTTTVAGYLLDLNTGRTLAVSGAANPQARYGADVISRIKYATASRERLMELSGLIIGALNRLIAWLVKEAGIEREQIYRVVLVGNTCMHHLLFGINPSQLGRSPYLPVIREACTVTAGELGLELLNQIPVCFLPNIDGFVGADTVGLILATGMHRSSQFNLAVDLGTNGEIVLGTREKLVCCSTAAGPAFEGTNIHHGMRAEAGAISRVKINNSVETEVIGDVPARGICGSGLVDTVAELLRLGLVEPSGRLKGPDEVEEQLSPELRHRLIKENGQSSFILLFPGEKGARKSIMVTQQDIRQLQLAKGAILAGIQILIKELGVSYDQISRIYLAGGFGNHIDVNSAWKIGLFPRFSRAKVVHVGNAAAAGACRALLSVDEWRQAGELASRVEHVNLATNPAYSRSFMKAMCFSSNFFRGTVKCFTAG